MSVENDALARIFKPATRSSVEVVLAENRTGRKYRDEDFPMIPDEFETFRNDIIQNLQRILGLESWAVRNPKGKESHLKDRFRFRLLETIERHGIEMEVGVIEIAETGDAVPSVICLPETSRVRPGLCVFSGHSAHGLRDLTIDLESYQEGVAARLAQSGFVSIAIEKIDSGYLARAFGDGVDEPEIGTLRLAWGRPTRSHQLMACIAAAEILAGHPRVDETRIGATGVSLGGWLSIETALLSDRITALADFGKKTVNLNPASKPDAFVGMKDICHIYPGMLSICDRNLVALACCPMPMLAGHGEKDATSHAESPVHFRPIFEAQYEALGQADRYEYHVHGGGDVMPADAVIEYFRRIWG